MRQSCYVLVSVRDPGLFPGRYFRLVGSRFAARRTEKKVDAVDLAIAGNFVRLQNCFKHLFLSKVEAEHGLQLVLPRQLWSDCVWRVRRKDRSKDSFKKLYMFQHPLVIRNIQHGVPVKINGSQHLRILID